MRKEFLEYIMDGDKVYINIDSIDEVLTKLIYDMKNDKNVSNSVWIIENIKESLNKFKGKLI